MEKIKIIIILSIVLMLFSNCSNEYDEITFEQKSELQKVIALQNSDEQKIAFKMLSSENKFNIWKMKYNLLKKGDFTVFKEKRMNKKQIFILNELFTSLKLEYFENRNSKKSINYFSKELPILRKKALEVFTKEELKFLISSINTPIMQSRGINCGCSQASDYCGSGSCSLPCTDSSSWGCGTFWSYGCDGACGTITINHF